MVEVPRISRLAERKLLRAAERELTANLERLSRYVATVQALQASGRSITNDVLKIRSARDSAELLLSVAHNETRRATVNLGSLLGDHYEAVEHYAGPVSTGIVAAAFLLWLTRLVLQFVRPRGD